MCVCAVAVGGTHPRIKQLPRSAQSRAVLHFVLWNVHDGAERVLLLLGGEPRGDPVLPALVVEDECGRPELEVPLAHFL